MGGVHQMKDSDRLKRIDELVAELAWLRAGLDSPPKEAPRGS